MSVNVNERAADLSASTSDMPISEQSIRQRAEKCLASRLKRLMDLGGSLFGIVALSPLFLLLSILIYGQDRGPVFFRQRRTGLNGEVFLIWKFRTMAHEPRNTTFEQTRGRNDSRVTPLGRWLRTSSLDELPQLLNVVKGEMSLVGPRPHPVELDRSFAPRLEAYTLRHAVRPGLTGLAQITGARGPINSPQDMQKRLDLDLAYISNWSLSGDILLVLKTVFSPTDRQKAY